MNRKVTSDLNSKNRIKHLPPIIGYDQEFWTHCLEKDREEVSKLLQSENRKQYALNMRCSNNHIIKLTPYMFFTRNKRCIYCINPGEQGAVHFDEAIRAFWDDDRFDPEIISENSDEQFRFKCPFCGEQFTASVSKMIFKHPKCQQCNDGNTPNPYNKLDEIFFAQHYWIR